MSSVVMTLLGGAIFSIMVIEQLLKYLFPKAKTGIKLFNYVSRFLNIAILMIAIFLGVLSTNENARNFTFSRMITSMSSYPNPMDAMRCEPIQHIHGRVLEIGPGPGTNFRCWQNNTRITEWVGVEPNPYFQEVQAAQSRKMNISFPTRTVWLKGENVDIEPESFDFVVGSHVLCSVDDVSMVLRQVKRALKPGGVYHFMEHVSAPAGSALDGWQQFFAPLFYVVGNGCKFKSLWSDLRADAGLSGFEVSLKFVDANIPISLIVPHVSGTATKL